MLTFQRRLALFVIALAVAGCSAAPTPMPPEAPGVVTPERYAFGDVIRSRDWHATVQVLDRLEERFGQKSMRIEARNLPATTDPEAIRAHYYQLLPEWRALDVGRDTWNQSWSFGLVSPDGTKALAVVALRPDDVVNTDHVPMNILTNLEELKP